MDIKSGMALLNGVKFISDKYEATATRNKDKTIKVNHKPVKDGSNSILFKIPFIRGLAVLGKAVMMNKKLFFSILAFNISLKIFNNISEKSIGESLTFLLPFPDFITYIIIGGIIFLAFQPTAKYHGAEHKVFNAHLKNIPLTLENVSKQSRLCKECGTNIFVVIVLIVLSLLQVDINAYLRLLIAISLGYELLILENQFIMKLLYLPNLIGYGLQRFITTSEPKEQHLEVALASVNKLIELEK